MTLNKLRELEKARRKALWALASLYPGDPEAFAHLAILDHLDGQPTRQSASNKCAILFRHSTTAAESKSSWNTTYPNRGENASCKQASDQPGLLMGFTSRTGINS